MKTVSKMNFLSKIRYATNICFLFLLNLNVFGISFRQFCSPGFNCHGCPWGTFACPVGAIGYSFTLRSFPFFAIGFVLAIALFFGRLVCSYVCPFGFFQDLVHRIPWIPKYKLHKYARYGKYVCLALLVVIFPWAIGFEDEAPYVQIEFTPSSNDSNSILVTDIQISNLSTVPLKGLPLLIEYLDADQKPIEKWPAENRYYPNLEIAPGGKIKLPDFTAKNIFAEKGSIIISSPYNRPFRAAPWKLYFCEWCPSGELTAAMPKKIARLLGVENPTNDMFCWNLIDLNQWSSFISEYFSKKTSESEKNEESTETIEANENAESAEQNTCPIPAGLLDEPKEAESAEQNTCPIPAGLLDEPKEAESAEQNTCPIPAGLLDEPKEAESAEQNTCPIPAGLLDEPKNAESAEQNTCPIPAGLLDEPKNAESAEQNTCPIPTELLNKNSPKESISNNDPFNTVDYQPVVVKGFLDLRLVITIGLLILMLFFSRPFCRLMCPLGALFALITPFSFTKITLNKSACINCGLCDKVCPMDLDVRKEIGSMECIFCGNCVKRCPKKALVRSFGFSSPKFELCDKKEQNTPQKK